MADDRSPEEIEREIEAERAELSQTIDTLTDKFSVDRMVRETQAYLSENGGELSRNALRTVRETPIAALLTLVGVTWMIVGSQNRRVIEYRDRTMPTGDGYGRDHGRDSGASGATGYVGGTPRGSGYASTVAPGSAYGSSEALGSSGGEGDDDFDARVAAADARMRSNATGTSGLMADDRAAYERYDPSRDTVSRDYTAYKREGEEDDDSTFDRISDQAQDLWHETIAAVRSSYRSAKLGARNTYQSSYRSATELRDRLIEGTEGMNAAGRERVAQARARAYQAQLRTQTAAQRGSQRANDFFYEQPLVAGAVAMALGAAVGGLLPRTRREDEAFGAYRDQLFDDAEAVFREERMRVEAAGRAALAETTNIAEEAKDSVLGKTPDGRETVREAESQARTAAQRVADAAREAHDAGSAAGKTTSTA